MAISANKLKMVRQRTFLPVQSHGGFLGSAETGLVDAGVTQAEVAAAGYGAAVFASGEQFCWFNLIPNDWDRDNNLYIRVVFTSASTTAADDFLFTCLYDAIVPNNDDVIILPATALDTIIPGDTTGTDATGDALKITEPGIINGGSIGNTATYIAFVIDATTADAVPEVFGLEIEYTPKLYKGHVIQAPAWQNQN